MARRSVSVVGPLAVSLCSLFHAAPSHSQTTPLPERCTASASDAKHDSPSGHKVVIDSIIFDKPSVLPDSDIKRIMVEDNDWGTTTGSGDWIDKVNEIGIRGAYQDSGYFKISSTAEARSLGVEGDQEHFQLLVHADEGLQYHLGDLTFVNSLPERPLAFSDDQLRSSFGVQPGELFDVSAIRGGVEKLTKFYVSQGYIDFTAGPQFDVDDKLQRISLAFTPDEQKQFWVRNLEILGLAPELDARLRSLVRPGEIFNQAAVEDFHKTNELPSWSAHDITRNRTTGTVDLRLDFRACPTILITR
jgi:outer membrane protein assembly factor BamA